MKPFNRELAAQGAKLVTRDGRKVIHYHDTKLDIHYPIIALIEFEDSDPEFFTYKADGNYKILECDKDLFMAPEEEFVAVFEDTMGEKFAIVGTQSRINEMPSFKKLKQFPL